MKKVLMMLALFCIVVVVGVGTADAKRSTDYRNALVFAYSPVSSVYEDDNIKLEIYDEQLWATNKTNRTIFIDRSQCFLINNGSSYPMWSEATDEKKASKANVSSIDVFVAIPPSAGNKQNETFICNLAGLMYGKYSTSEGPSGSFSDYEKRLLTLIDEMVTESQSADPKGKKYVGSVSRHLTEDESVSNIGASLAYAFNKRAEEWTPVQISTWVSDVVFTPYYVEMPKDLSKKEKRGFGVKETDPAKVHIMASSPYEFDSEKMPLVVCDWEGDFKKGTFELNFAKVAKKKGKKIGLGILATLIAGPAGAAAFFQPSSETFYKSVVVFDGSDADWGKMSYVDDIMKTKQSD